MTRPIADIQWIADNSDEMSQVNQWTIYYFKGSSSRSVVVSVIHLRMLMEVCIRESDSDGGRYDIDIDMGSIYYVDDFKHMLRMIGRKDD